MAIVNCEFHCHISFFVYQVNTINIEAPLINILYLYIYIVHYGYCEL